MIDDDDEVRWRFEPSGPVRSTQFCWHCSGSSRSAFQNVWLLTTIITTSIFSSSSGSNTGTKAQVLQSIQQQNWPTNSAADNSKFDGLHSQGIEFGCLHSKSSNSTVGTSNPGTGRFFEFGEGTLKVLELKGRTPSRGEQANWGTGNRRTGNRAVQKLW